MFHSIRRSSHRAKKIMLSVAAAAMTLAPVAALATTPTSVVDFSSVGTDLTTLISTAATSILPVGTAVLGAYVGWRFIKHFTR